MGEDKQSLSVLFVCTGNICRSPIAEGVFREMVTQFGLNEGITTESAGMISYHAGEPPDPRAQAATLSLGIDIGAQCARQITPDDFEKFDFLIALDNGHRADLLDQAPTGAVDRIHLLMDFAPQWPEDDVPDPYYGGAEDFIRALEMIEAAVTGLLSKVRSRIP